MTCKGAQPNDVVNSLQTGGGSVYCPRKKLDNIHGRLQSSVNKFVCADKRNTDMLGGGDDEKQDTKLFTFDATYKR